MDNPKDKDIKDNLNSFVLLKIEKLALATYLVSNFWPDSEPLKGELRRQVLALVSDSKLTEDFFGHLLPGVDKIMSLINLAKVLPGVSIMNLDLLLQEYGKLRHSLASNIVSVGPEMAALLPERKLSPVQYSSKVAQIRPNSPNPRRQAVLSFIKQNGWSSITDVASAVPGVSTKTIQRELADLVQLGLLKREGERRWSRYLTI